MDQETRDEIEEHMARGTSPEDVFADVEEYNYNMEIGRGVLALKSLREAVDHLTEYGTSYGFDVVMRDSMVELLVAEQNALVHEITATWHHIMTDEDDAN